MAAFPMCLIGGATDDASVSDHFDGKRFFNREPAARYTMVERWQWARSTRSIEWPEWIDDPRYPAPPRSVATGMLRVTHINHATVLIQLDGVNILTDPIWSERASPFSWLGPRRVRAPGVHMRDLPKIDLILISHDHYDHLDYATLRALDDSHKPMIVAGQGVGQRLRTRGFKTVTELDWWQSYDARPSLKIVFVPARHGSGRGIFDHNRTLWGGFVIAAPAGNVYFAGDTGFGSFFDDVARRFAPFRVALLPLGHYEPRWMMEPVHMSPDDAVRAHRVLRAKHSVGMHFGTFHGFGAHNNETVDQHVADLHAALARHQVPASELWLLGFGEGRDVP